MPEKLSFYDVKGKKKFTSSSYKIVNKKGRRFAVAKAPSGIEAWRIMGKSWMNTAKARDLAYKFYQKKDYKKAHKWYSLALKLYPSHLIGELAMADKAHLKKMAQESKELFKLGYGRQNKCHQ